MTKLPQKQASELRILRRHVELLRDQMRAVEAAIEAHRAFVETYAGCLHCSHTSEQEREA